MASEYNSRPLPAELLIRRDKVEVIRGNYKMIVMGRQNDPAQSMGWEASGAHIQDFAPGTMPGASLMLEWIEANPGVPMDVFVEKIPYSETRGYVKRVLEYAAIYALRAGRTPTRLSAHLRPIQPAS